MSKTRCSYFLPTLLLIPPILLYTGVIKTCAETRWIDLTHPFDQTTIYWPTGKPFQLEVVHKGLTKQGFWYESNNYGASEHGGTHIDAPAHFARGKWSVDQIPLSRLIGAGVKVDVSAKVKTDPDYLITERDFLDWEEQYGRIPAGAIVLVHTGWEKFWRDKKKYLGTAERGDTANLHFPGFGKEAALFLTQKRNVGSVGLDTASLDYGQSKDFPAHRVFGQANVPGFENLHQLNLLPALGFRVIALPMKIGKGSGGPLRIIVELD
ncbi:MAG: cyclase family protein [Nitrospinales bacterium]